MLRSQDTQCLYALVEVEPKNDRVQTATKMTKINLKITGKPHVHLQTLKKTSVKFQKYPAKIVGEVAFTRYAVSICFGRS